MEDISATLFAPIETDNDRQTGIPPGIQADRLGHPVRCERCRDIYYVVRIRPDRNYSRLCVSCRGKIGQAKCQSGFVTPESEKLVRIRAAGLVNKRIKLGWFKKPRACQKCGAEKRLDAHHRDYSLPHLVHYLCRSCHNHSHRDGTFLDGIAPTDTGGPPDPRQQNQGGRTTASPLSRPEASR